MTFHVPERFRVLDGPLGSCFADGNQGVFQFYNRKGEKLVCIAASGNETGWEHVSCHVEYISNGRNKRRTPSWNDMCHVKNMFWDFEDCVVQYHPPQSQYVNDSIYVLHLWRPVGVELPMPPKECV